MRVKLLKLALVTQRCKAQLQQQGYCEQPKQCETEAQVDPAQSKKLAKQGKLKLGKKRKRDEGDHAEYGVTRGVDFRGVKTVINVDAPSTVSG